MTKEEFVSRLVNQFSGMAKNARRSAEKEIEGHRGRTDAEGFKTWLRAEQAAALQTPALRVFDAVLRASMGTPEEAAQALANSIAFDHQHRKQAVDWQYQFEQAAPILTNHKPEKSEGWKYRQNLDQYIQAMKSEDRAKAFSDYLGQSWPAGSVLAKFGKGDAEALEFRREVQRRGNAYFLLWDECKDIFGDPDLPEREFLLDDIEHCEEEIARWKDKTHSFRDAWTGLLKANIRAHRERLEALAQDAAKKAPGSKRAVSEPRTFAELLKIPDDEKSVVSALVGAELIFEDTTQWKDQRTTGAIRAVFEALEDAKMIHEAELTPGCRLIAKRFGVKVVKNYPKAGFTDKLRRAIKSRLDNNRDNNRDGI